MDRQEFFGNALGVALVLIASLAVLGLIGLALASLPFLMTIFPLTIGIVTLVLVIGYVRHRRRQQALRRRHDRNDGDTPRT